MLVRDTLKEAVDNLASRWLFRILFTSNKSTNGRFLRDSMITSMVTFFREVELCNPIKAFGHRNRHKIGVRGAALLLLVLMSISAEAQLYRPDSLVWREAFTPHFRIIYAQGDDSVAEASARILEAHYARIAEYTGGYLNRFPVVLNSYNDLSNGFVSSVLFRTEIEIPRIISKSLNPRNGGWLETVLPHELVHALHINTIPSPGLGAFIAPVSPDLARSMHFGNPVGFHEGIAVHYESTVAPEAGRGQYPWFRNRFPSINSEASFYSSGQLLQPVSDTFPGDRHYLAGYEFMEWTQETYGLKTTRDIIDFSSRWPFLGFGIAFWDRTGDSPFKAYTAFKKQKMEERDRLVKSIPHPTQATIVPFEKGRTLTRRPQWETDSTLIFWSQAYNRRPGFFRYYLTSQKSELIAYTQLASDRWYEIDREQNRILFARNRVDPIWSNTFRSDIYAIDLASGQEARLTKDARLHAPARTSIGLLALQIRKESTDLVEVKGETHLRTLLTLGRNPVTAFDEHPAIPRLFAIQANKNGRQGVWIVTDSKFQDVATHPPEIAFEKGSIFDIQWHPSRKALTFSSDHTGILSVYEYNMETRQYHALITHPFNTFEAQWSPQGDRLAFIQLEDAFFQPAIVSQHLIRSDSSYMMNEKDVRIPPLIATNYDSTFVFRSSGYRSWPEWLKPRFFVPTLTQENSPIGVYPGLYMQSQDFLQRHYYEASLSYHNRKIWFEGEYLYTGFYPGIRVSVSDAPLVYGLRINRNGRISVEQNVLGEQELELSIPFQYKFDQNVNQSAFFVTPSLSASNRYVHTLPTGIPLAPVDSIFSGQSTFSGLSLTYYRGVYQAIRDVQPRSGWLVFGEAKALMSTTISGLTPGVAWVAGARTWIAPLINRFNQSIRLEARYIHQPDVRFFSTRGLSSFAFENDPVVNETSVLSFKTRFTTPLGFPENGGMLIPWYLQNMYGVIFSEHIGAVNAFSTSEKSIFHLGGIGLRFLTGISNLRLDIGLSYVYDFANNRTTFFFGDF